MKFMLAIALTAVLVGYSTASFGSIWKCFRGKLEPKSNKGASQGEKGALQGNKGTSQGEKGALQGYKGTSQSEIEDCPQEGPSEYINCDPLMSFSSNVTVDQTKCRNDFNAREFIQVPRVQLMGAYWNSDYTLLFVREMSELHWAVSNIPGCYLTGGIGNINHFTMLTGDYQPPVVEAGRYTTFRALLYRQRRKVYDIRASNGSLPVIDKVFVQRHGLCGPVAALQFDIFA